MREVPKALDMERSLIGAIVSIPEVYDKVYRIVKPDDFYNHHYKTIYKAVNDIKDKDLNIDMITVRQRLSEVLKGNSFNECFISMVDAMKDINVVKNPEYMAAIVQQYSKRRSFIAMANDLMQQAYDESVDIADILQLAESDIYEITKNGSSKDVVHCRDIVPIVYEEITKAAASDGEMTGVPSDITDLDKITGGFQRSDLVIIAARPAMGKTALGLTVASNISLVNDGKAAFFSLEMSNEQLVKRCASILGSINSSKLRDGRLDSTDWRNLDKSLGMILDGNLYIDDTPSLNILEFKSKARRLVQDYGVKIIIIDYIQLMTAKVKGNRQEEVSAISRALKATAKELDIPIIALAQLNRDVEGREGGMGKKPKLSDLRESGAIEQDADVVMSIYRPEYYGIKQDEQGNNTQGIAEISILKHRNGALGDVKTRFRGEYTRFENLNDTLVVSDAPF